MPRTDVSVCMPFSVALRKDIQTLTVWTIYSVYRPSHAPARLLPRGGARKGGGDILLGEVLVRAEGYTTTDLPAFAEATADSAFYG
ncbi:MAG: hypothetical protein GVY26_01175 [Bacteroidetes bacterium]|nr:hypothetical protein [Bacteroidota bacterium]